MSPDPLMVVLNFQHFDVNNPNYQTLQFFEVPLFGIFRWKGKFMKKGGVNFARELTTDSNSVIEPDQFILAARPIQMDEPIGPKYADYLED